MRAIPKSVIALMLLLVAGGIFFLILTKPKPVAPPPIVAEDTSPSLNEYVEKVSREREEEQDRHYEERKQTKLAVAKKNSVECQFWKQQKPSKKTEDKIAQFCEVQTATP